MLFTNPDSDNLSKDSWKYLALQCQIELKKLRCQLANEEKMELREVARVKQSKWSTIAALATNSADQAHTADHSNHGDNGHKHNNDHDCKDDEQGDLPNGDLTQTQCTTHDLWNLQIDPKEDPDADDINIDVNIDVNVTCTIVFQLRCGSLDVPKELLDLQQRIQRSQTQASVNAGRGPMTIEAIRHSLPTSSENPTQGGDIDLKTHVSPPKWGRGLQQGLVQ